MCGTSYFLEYGFINELNSNQRALAYYLVFNYDIFEMWNCRKADEKVPEHIQERFNIRSTIEFDKAVTASILAYMPHFDLSVVFQPHHLLLLIRISGQCLNAPNQTALDLYHSLAKTEYQQLAKWMYEAHLREKALKSR